MDIRCENINEFRTVVSQFRGSPFDWHSFEADLLVEVYEDEGGGPEATENKLRDFIDDLQMSAEFDLEE